MNITIKECSMTGYTAADMADQAAAAFERGRESVLAELHAAAQEAVRQPDGYHYRYPDMYGTDTYIRKNNGEEVSGIKPVEAVPYWYAPVTAAQGIDRCSLLDIVAWWDSYTGPVDEALGEVIRRIRTLIDASPNGVHFVDATKMVQDSPKGGSEARALLDALVSLVAVARRYLPDYDEHPEVQKADDAIDAARRRRLE